MVLLNEVSKIKAFVEDVSNLGADIDVVSGRYVVCASSIMGLFSLDLSKPIEVVIHSEDENTLNKFAGVIQKYAV